MTDHADRNDYHRRRRAGEEIVGRDQLMADAAHLAGAARIARYEQLVREHMPAADLAQPTPEQAAAVLADTPLGRLSTGVREQMDADAQARAEAA